MNVVVAEEFRDGNVPVLKDPKRVAQRAFATLPETIRERYFRGDSGCDEEGLLSWLRNPESSELIRQEEIAENLLKPATFFHPAAVTDATSAPSIALRLR